MTFTVKGRPVPAARMTRRQVQTYQITDQAKRYLDYKDRVGWTAKAAGIKPLRGDVKVSIDLYLYGNNEGDIDNYAKAICDGLNLIAYKDDKQITDLRVQKFKVAEKQLQRADISIEEDPELRWRDSRKDG